MSAWFLLFLAVNSADSRSDSGAPGSLTNWDDSALPLNKTKLIPLIMKKANLHGFATFEVAHTLANQFAKRIYILSNNNWSWRCQPWLWWFCQMVKNWFASSLFRRSKGAGVRFMRRRRVQVMRQNEHNKMIMIIKVSESHVTISTHRATAIPSELVDVSSNGGWMHFLSIIISCGKWLWKWLAAPTALFVATRPPISYLFLFFPPSFMQILSALILLTSHH